MTTTTTARVEKSGARRAWERRRKPLIRENGSGWAGVLRDERRPVAEEVKIGPGVILGVDIDPTLDVEKAVASAIALRKVEGRWPGALGHPCPVCATDTHAGTVCLACVERRTFTGDRVPCDKRPGEPCARCGWLDARLERCVVCRADEAAKGGKR